MRQAAQVERELGWLLRELLAIDTADVLRQLTCPTLLVGGAHDCQCDPEDVAEPRRCCGDPCITAAS